MIIKWYNRDEFSDQDIIRAKAAADRLLGKRGITQADYDDLTKTVMLKSRQLGTSSYKNFLLDRLGWEPAPQWAKDAKEDDLRREPR